MKLYKGFEISLFEGIVNVTADFRPKYKAVNKYNRIAIKGVEIIGDTLKDIKNQINKHLNYTHEDFRKDLIQFAEEYKHTDFVKFYFNS